jgi:hypothetical protein
MRLFGQKFPPPEKDAPKPAGRPELLRRTEITIEEEWITRVAPHPPIGNAVEPVVEGGVPELQPRSRSPALGTGPPKPE